MAKGNIKWKGRWRYKLPGSVDESVQSGSEEVSAPYNDKVAATREIRAVATRKLRLSDEKLGVFINIHRVRPAKLGSYKNKIKTGDR